MKLIHACLFNSIQTLIATFGQTDDDITSYTSSVPVTIDSPVKGVQIIVQGQVANLTVHLAGCQKLSMTVETTTISETTAAEQSTTVSSTTIESTTPETTTNAISTTFTSTTKGITCNVYPIACNVTLSQQRRIG